MHPRSTPTPVHHRPTCPALATLVVIGLVAAGCGDGGSSTAASPRAPSKSEFVAKANAICRRGNEEVNAAFARLDGPERPTRAQIEHVVKTTFAPSVQQQIDGMRALGTPAGDEATVSHFLGLAQADLEKIKRDPMLVTSDTDTFADFAKLAHPYGLTECDTSGGAS